MPEMKKQFTKGKMNKDLDERLVPNGEYRDAMNIQVATSEDGDVATVQNILGNSRIPILVKSPFGGAIGVGPTLAPFIFPSEAKVVASISDEKVDTLYWFIWTPDIDYIISYNKNDASPRFIFVDKNKSALKFSEDYVITGINIIDGMIFWTDNRTEPKKINIQRCLAGTTDPYNGIPTSIIFAQQTKLINLDAQLGPAGGPTSNNTPVDIEEKHITVIKKAPPKPMGMELEGVRENDRVYTGIINLETDDDAVNTSSFAQQSYFNGPQTIADQSDVYDFSAFDVGDVVAIRISEGITNNGNIVNLGALNNPTSGLTGWQTGNNNDILEGTKVVLSVFDDYNDPPGLPITDYSIKGILVSSNAGTTTTSVPNGQGGVIYLEITNIVGYAPQADPTIGQQTLQMAIDLFDEEEKLFEFKFPRFSYRYKYEDGEYSPFAPFTQVAFVPGSFDYHPKKGYNLGMANTIRAIRLSRFLNKKTPQDVVAVDILFKDEPSPVIYVVDTLKPKDNALNNAQFLSGVPLNAWNTVRNGGQYVIEKETVNQVVEENQLLRPWDNVPRRALAQDVTGNRVVYANYVQNYDLLTQSGSQYYPEFKTAWKEFNPLPAQSNKSCKTLREYQLGVVFIDKYGRETPVISNPSGTMKLEKERAALNNRIRVGLKGDITNHPQDVDYMKFFVKETSGEYYNMAMDRWYNAEDDNVWLAFPSNERNKIDIDTFLILKKGSDQDNLVTEPARYKVLAIESEAPDFIKTKPLLVNEIVHYYPSYDAGGTLLSDNTPIFENDISNAPIEGIKEFKLLYNQYKDSTASNLHEYLATGNGELYIEFAHQTEEEISNRYKITNITCTWDGGTVQDDDTFNIQTEKPLGNDVNFISDDPTGLDPQQITDGTIIRFYKYEVINAAQFDGRFFVKIYMDDVFKQNIEKQYKTEEGYRVLQEEMIYYMKENWFEQFTQHMSWWFTAGYQESERDNDGFMGSRIHSPAYTYPNFNTKASGNDFFGSIWSLMNRTALMKYWGAPGDNDYDHAEEHGGSSYNTDSNGNLKHYGHYGNDKFMASALYFRRYKLIDNEYHDNSFNLTFDSSLYGSWSGRYNHRWAYCYFTSGDKRDPNNWVHVSEAQHEANWGVGSHFSYYDQVGDGWREYVFEGPRWQGSGDGSSEPSHNCYQYKAGTYEDNYNACRDAEVWFIDNGRITGKRTTSNDLVLNDADGEYHQYITENDYNCDKDGSAGGPRGLVKYQGANKHSLYLSFGGIFGMRNPGGGTTTHKHENHFGIGAWNDKDNNGFYDDTNLNNFVGKMNPGYRYKWKEDPTKTLFTLGARIYGDGRYLNHSTRRGTYKGKTYSLKLKKAPTRFNMSRNMDGAVAHNYRKGWRMFDIVPVPVWDPTVQGKIPAGLEIKLTPCNSSGGDTDNGNVTTGDQTGPNGNEVSIYVKTLVDSNSNYGVKKLHEGMALQSFKRASDNTTVTIQSISGFNDTNEKWHTGNDFLVVIKIIPRDTSGAVNALKPNYYELQLGGYNFPMQENDHSWLQAPGSTTHPQVGTNGEYHFVQVGMNGHNSNTEFNINENAYKIGSQNGNGQAFGKIGAVGYKIQFVDEIEPEEVFPTNPAIWETEPKETKDLDIYYEATGAIPFNFTAENVHEAFPIGSYITPPGQWLSIASGEPVYVYGYLNEEILLSEINPIAVDDINTNIDDTIAVPINSSLYFQANGIYFVTTPSGLTFSVEVTGIGNALNISAITIEPRLYNGNFELPYFNCYSFGNGVESNRIRDNFNLPFISNGVKVSTTLEADYKEERRQYGLIYSGIYNSISGVNNLNQFIQAEKITKDVNPIYGSIQKLHSRDSDLVTFCEDKVLRIQANKDALFNADGNTNVTASSNVLGQAIPFAGEYGISTNPESFASEDYRVYFTDKVRGKVLRLSRDGMTPISQYGMTDWFKDNLRLVPDEGKIMGSYDDRNDEYNLKLEIKENVTDEAFTPKIITYSEKVKGWVSFKSFIEMQNAVSMANDYYTFFEGELYKHYDETVDRNTFYGNFTESSFDVVLNDQPSLVKVYNTLNYEGTQSRVQPFVNELVQLDFQPNTTYNDQRIYNLAKKEGWYVETIVTNKETGEINEFIEKEGKWFNAVNKVVDIVVEKADTADFSFQGIGTVGNIGSVVTGGGTTMQCPVPTISVNANSDLTFVIPPPTPLSATLGGYDTYAWTLTSPTGIVTTGSTGVLPSVSNADLLSNGTGDWTFDVQFNWVDITSCTSTATIYIAPGCTNSQAVNYDANANLDDGSCRLPDPIFGCTDPTASNYNPAATQDDGSCQYRLPNDPIDFGDLDIPTDDDDDTRGEISEIATPLQEPIKEEPVKEESVIELISEVLLEPTPEIDADAYDDGSSPDDSEEDIKKIKKGY